jgi:hypothetical protein
MTKRKPNPLIPLPQELLSAYEDLYYRAHILIEGNKDLYSKHVTAMISAVDKIAQLKGDRINAAWSE